MTQSSDKGKAPKKVGAKKAAAKKAAPAQAPAKKAPVKKAAPKKAAVKKTAPKAGQRASATAPSRITHEERWRMIAEAAYWRAEKRGFSGSGEVEDWLAAEADIDGQLAAAGIEVVN